jgi:hypothetical protein
MMYDEMLNERTFAEEPPATRRDWIILGAVVAWIFVLVFGGLWLAGTFQPTNWYGKGYAYALETQQGSGYPANRFCLDTYLDAQVQPQTHSGAPIAAITSPGGHAWMRGCMAGMHTMWGTTNQVVR